MEGEREGGREGEREGGMEGGTEGEREGGEEGGRRSSSTHLCRMKDDIINPVVSMDNSCRINHYIYHESVTSVREGYTKMVFSMGNVCLQPLH